MQAGLRAISRARLASTSRLRSPFTLSRPQYQFSQLRALSTKHYTEDHEIVKFDDATGVGIVGITEHAQSQLGDVVYVELPTVGTEVQQGDQIGAVESVKAASDIYAPISGVIEEINENLNDQPGLLNKSPEDAGWLCKIKASNPSEVEQLLNSEQYAKKVEEGH